MHLIEMVWRLSFCVVLFPVLLHSTIYYSNEDHQLHLELAKKFPSVGMLSLQFISKYEEVDESSPKRRVMSSLDTSAFENTCSAVLIDSSRIVTFAACVAPLHQGFVLDTRFESKKNTFELDVDSMKNRLAGRDIHTILGLSADAHTKELANKTILLGEVGTVIVNPSFGSKQERAKNQALLGTLNKAEKLAVVYLKKPMKKYPGVPLDGTLKLQFVTKEKAKKYEQQKRKLIRSNCSGVLVDPLTVLTIAQCVQPLLEGYEFDQNTNFLGANTFKLGDDVGIAPTAAAKVKAAVFYPGHKIDNELGQAQNLVLLYLDKPIYNVEPAALFEENLDKSSFNSKKVALVGFGLHGLPWSPYLPQNDAFLPSQRMLDFNKRGCWQRIKEFKRSVFETLFSLDGQQGFGMFTHGEQGGGMFVEHKGSWYLVGINSHRINRQELSEATDIGFETTGISLALPSYLGWIRENQALRKAESSSMVSDSEWTLSANWKSGVFPHNKIEESSLYHATFNAPSTIIADNFISLEQLTLANRKAVLFIPEKLSVKLTREEVNRYTKALFKKGEKFEAIEYQRSLITKPDSEELYRILKFEARTVELQNGVIDVAGELWFDHLLMSGGELRGKGTLIYGAIPIVNGYAQVTPGAIDGTGTLTMTGDYEQLSASDTIPGGSLRIRVNKKGTSIRNSVLHVQGEAKLGGTLIIEETGQPLLHNDRIKFLYGRNSGKFASVQLPPHLDAEFIYGQDYVTLVIKDIHHEQAIIVGKAEALQWERFKKLHSLTIDGGRLSANRLRIEEGLLMRDGQLLVSNKAPERTLRLVGDYQQIGGNLVLTIAKELVELVDAKEYFMNEDGSLTLANEAREHESRKKIVTKIGTPEFKWSNDKIKVTGSAQLGGKLTLQFDDEMLIKEGLRFTLFEADHISGTFNQVTPFPGLVQPKIHYGERKVEVEFVLEKRLTVFNFANLEARIAAWIYDTEYATEAGRKKYASMFLLLNGLDAEQMENYLLAMVIKSPNYQRLRKQYDGHSEIRKIQQQHEYEQRVFDEYGNEAKVMEEWEENSRQYYHSL